MLGPRPRPRAEGKGPRAEGRGERGVRREEMRREKSRSGGHYGRWVVAAYQAAMKPRHYESVARGATATGVLP